MENITRRGMLGALGLAGMAGIAAGAPQHAFAVDDKALQAVDTMSAAGEVASIDTVQDNRDMQTFGTAPVEATELTGWTGTPQHIADLGGSTMPLAEMNRRRKEYLDSQTEYVMEDGTVVPAVYTKVRALIHSYGIGSGNTPIDSSFTELMNEMSEEQAQAFLDMPWGEKFTALDLFEKGGRTLDECREVCDYLADTGYLCRFETNAGTMYHQVPYFTGTYEYHQRKTIESGGTFVHPIVGADLTPNDMATTGTPVYYAIPCDESVVGEGGILLYDDVHKIIDGRNTFALATCYCRYQALVRALEAEGNHDYPSIEDFASGQYEDYMSPVDGHRVETCLLMGDEAEYWVSLGVARYITKEDARRFMERSRDDGFILQSIYSKVTENICSCHGDCCGIIGMWRALGGKEDIEGSKSFSQMTHYTLEVDFDSCAKCGTCAARCPLSAITMDGEYNGETGFPQVTDLCFRCGQCAYVCPMEARKLVLRPEDEILEMPYDVLDAVNQQTGYRFEHELIF